MAIVLSLAMIAVVAAGAGLLLYRHLNSNITTDNSADGLLGRPTVSASGSASASASATGPTLQPMNILVMGSDTRQGQGGIGGSTAIAGARSDVTMIIHLSADRKRALVYNIPRDTLVTIPSCRKPNGSMSQPQTTKFNAAFSIGGPACTIKTFKQLTGVAVDHFIVIDFSGFEKVINALGGVTICVSQAIHDPVQDHEGSGLELSAGTHLLMGEQALEFVRVRHNVTDGSDTARIPRQHAFLGAMVKKVHDSSLLTSPLQLYRVLDATTKSITADPGLANLGALKDLAESLTKLKPSAVSFIPTPWYPAGDGANVLINQAKAQPIYDAMNNDTPYPPPVVTPVGPALKTAPSAVTVKVFNATGTPGRAKAVAAQLEALGFHVSGVATAPTVSPLTVVHYSPAYDESGRTLTASVQGATSVSDSSLGGTLELFVGTDFTGVQAVTVASASTPPAAVRTAADSSCVI
jgi:LCP family protein required for cell wall assembly